MKERARKPRTGEPRGYTIGRDGFAKISAIEGIQVTPAMDKDFRSFERDGLSPEQRRKAIAMKYGKAR